MLDRLAVHFVILACAGCASSTPGLESAVPPPTADAHALTDQGEFSIRHVITLYELVVQYPSPPWSPRPEAIEASQFNQEQDGPRFSMEQIPEGETFANWTRLALISAIHAKDAQLDNFKALTVGEWEQICGKETLSYQVIQELPDRWQVLISCERTGGGASAQGWGIDIGAIVLMDLQRLSNTFVRVQHTWRGAAFERTRSSSWPVTEERIREMLNRYTKIQLAYKPNAKLIPHTDDLKLN